ncbi:hypothetical protein GCM10022224_088660 [Nonomuraea antimicrobica]|uniref:Uncharacterized protein n=1 Tax=Nonomuraea antimicrobica TaxID=561173 RepID=A0ABP7DXL4_9ACTN
MLWRAHQPFGFADAGVAFDGVERQARAAGAFQQPGTLVGQGMDLLPALARGGGPYPFFRRRAGPAPADRVRGDLLHHGFGQVVPDMQAIVFDDRPEYRLRRLRSVQRSVTGCQIACRPRATMVQPV